ncbi:MAG: hypothetical protein J7605_24090 [Variovorax sp.]|nr:hypothetical protein [Variovorax sp.]
MDEGAIRQRLAAVLAADVAGYSRLMSSDELATIAALDAGRRIFRNHIETHQGRVVDMAGDSVLAVFDTAIGAITAALAIQEIINSSVAELPSERRMLFRIGVHLGDLIEKSDGTVYGDGVNIASRLEGLAEPGGVTISGVVQEAVRSRLRARFEDIGEQSVKNIPDPVHAFRVRTQTASDTSATSPAAVKTRASTPSEDKPSVMFQPFTSLGHDPQSQTLAAAAAEEIEASLARLTGLSLVTTSSVATYVVKGRVHSDAGHVRVTAHLVDQRTNREFWSDHFDSGSKGTLEALDDLALRISTAIRYEIHARECERAACRPDEELSNEELMSQAGHILLGSKRADWERSRRLIDVALSRNPASFMALSIRACGSLIEVFCGYKEPSADDLATCQRLIQRALELNERSDFAHLILASLHLYGNRHIAAAIREAKRCLELNPAYTLATDLLGSALIFSGKPEEGLPCCIHAAEANPRFPANAWYMQSVACGYFVMQRYGDAIEWARRADDRERNVPRFLLVLATSEWHAGQAGDARRTAARLIESAPGIRLGELRRWPFERTEDWDRFHDGLAASGLPA